MANRARTLILALAAVLTAGLLTVPLAAAAEPTTLEFPAPSAWGNEYATSMTVAPNGDVWWGTFSEKLDELDAAAAHAGTSDGFSQVAAGARGLVYGVSAAPDGTIWFSQWEEPFRGIDRLAGGDEPELVDGESLGAYALAFAPGTNDLWFAERQGPIGELTAGSGYVTHTKTINTTSSAAFSIAVDQSGNAWFPEEGGEIGEVKAGTEEIVHYPLGAGTNPQGITIDHAGNVWFTELGAGKIGELVPAEAAPETSKGITEYTIPLPAEAPTMRDGEPEKGEPTAIATAPNGTVWFAVKTSIEADDTPLNQIGEITPGSGHTATFTMIDTPKRDEPVALAVDSAGNVWYLSGTGTGGGYASNVDEIVDAAPAGEGSKGTTPPSETEPKGATPPTEPGSKGTVPPSETGSKGGGGGSTTTVVKGSAHASAPVVAGEEVTQRLQCIGPPADPCEIVLNLETQEEYDSAGFPVKIAHIARAKKLRRRIVIVGHTVAKLHGGQTSTVTVKLDAKGKKLLKKFHSLPAKLTVSESSGAGKASVIHSSSVTLKPSKRKPAKKRR
jgi:streptogramin lyase